jgi:hypothetical protein
MTGGLFRTGDFTLSSGARSDFKLDCDALADADLDCLAALIRRLVGPFRDVEGIPRGGLRLAEALRPLRGLGGPYLLADDVLTTGKSLEAVRAARVKSWPWGPPNAPAPPIAGAVIFARGPLPPWVKAVFQTPPELWLGGGEG